MSSARGARLTSLEACPCLPGEGPQKCAERHQRAARLLGLYRPRPWTRTRLEEGIHGAFLSGSPRGPSAVGRCVLSHARLRATPGLQPAQAPLCMGFPGRNGAWGAISLEDLHALISFSKLWAVQREHIAPLKCQSRQVTYTLNENSCLDALRQKTMITTKTPNAA